MIWFSRSVNCGWSCLRGEAIKKCDDIYYSYYSKWICMWHIIFIEKINKKICQHIEIWIWFFLLIDQYESSYVYSEIWYLSEKREVTKFGYKRSNFNEWIIWLKLMRFNFVSFFLSFFWCEINCDGRRSNFNGRIIWVKWMKFKFLSVSAKRIW